jgi:cytoskeleton protein RodZ
MGSFGDRLKKQREQRSISLDDISVSTKIGTRMLRALEEEKFEQLPGGIFNKGFVRAYARHVGLDEEQTLSDYLAALGEAQQQAAPAQPVPVSRPAAPAERPSAPVHHSPEREKTVEIPWGLLALGLLLAALIFATWSHYHRERRAETGTATPPPAAEVRPTEAKSAGATSQIPTAPTDRKSAPTTPIPSTDKPGAESAPVAQAALHGAASQESVPGAFTVLLKGNDIDDECWVSIAVDGQPPVEAILTAPQEKSVQATREVVVKAGNVAALDVSFNGKKLGRMGDYGMVRTLTFHSDGLQAPPPKAVPATPATR